MIDDGTAIHMLAAIATVPDVTPMARCVYLVVWWAKGTRNPYLTCKLRFAATTNSRVRCNSPDKIHFLLDAGALGIVCPLINTPKEVVDFVEACKYPPKGKRSYGPGRGHFASK
jgi:hypothetical protein